MIALWREVRGRSRGRRVMLNMNVKETLEFVEGTMLSGRMRLELHLVEMEVEKWEESRCGTELYRYN